MLFQKSCWLEQFRHVFPDEIALIFQHITILRREGDDTKTNDCIVEINNFQPNTCWERTIRKSIAYRQRAVVVCVTFPLSRRIFQTLFLTFSWSIERFGWNFIVLVSPIRGKCEVMNRNYWIDSRRRVKLWISRITGPCGGPARWSVNCQSEETFWKSRARFHHCNAISISTQRQCESLWRKKIKNVRKVAGNFSFPCQCGKSRKKGQH